MPSPPGRGPATPPPRTPGRGRGGGYLWRGGRRSRRAKRRLSPAGGGRTQGEPSTPSADPAVTFITLAGSLSVALSSNASVLTVTAPLIQVFGNSHNDVFIFNQTVLQGRTRVYGSQAPTGTGPAPEGDGNDTFFVNRLY